MIDTPSPSDAPRALSPPCRFHATKRIQRVLKQHCSWCLGVEPGPSPPWWQKLAGREAQRAQRTQIRHPPPGASLGHVTEKSTESSSKSVETAE